MTTSDEGSAPEPEGSAPVGAPTPATAPGSVGAPTPADSVPFGLRAAAEWTWRVLLVGVGVFAIGWVLSRFSAVTVPVAIAILLAALLAPMRSWLVRRRVPGVPASAITLVVGLAIVLAAITLISAQITGQASELATSATEGMNRLVDWLTDGPLQLAPEAVQSRIDQLIGQIPGQLEAWSGTILNYAAGVGSSVGSFFAGLFTALFAMFFFINGGRPIWSAVLTVAPRGARPALDAGGMAGWRALRGYVRTTIIVAAVDALGVLIGALALQLPLAATIAAVTFLGAFVPIIGALIAGFVGVLIALVTKGWIAALVMLGVVLAVQQIEGNLLQPLLMGKAVSLHPLAVLLGISVGVTLGGIVGAVVIIPVLAFIKAFVDAVNAREWLRPSAGPPVSERRATVDPE